MLNVACVETVLLHRLSVPQRPTLNPKTLPRWQQKLTLFKSGKFSSFKPPPLKRVAPSPFLTYYLPSEER